VHERRGDDSLVFDWLVHDRRIIELGIDDRTAHISKLLKFVTQMAGLNAKTSISFCGPVPFAMLVRDVAEELGSGFEFAADHQ
jgi:hypothetical protein